MARGRNLKTTPRNSHILLATLGYLPVFCMRFDCFPGEQGFASTAAAHLDRSQVGKVAHERVSMFAKCPAFATDAKGWVCGSVPQKHGAELGNVPR